MITRQSIEKIMLVEDDAIQRRLTVQSLKDHFEKIIVAETSSEAIELIDQHPDLTLILLDFEFPDAKAPEILKKIISNASKFDVGVLPKVIVVSGHVSNEQKLSVLRNGAADYVTKPWDPFELAVRAQNQSRLCALDRDLKRQAIYHRLVIEEFVVAVVTSDRKGNVIQWNRQAESIFGYSANEILGSNIEKLVPDRMLEQHHIGMARYLETGDKLLVDNGEFIDLEGKHKHGTSIPISMKLIEIDTGSEKIITAVIFNR
jgi:PAS domain S-box-containing protein